MTSAPLRVVVVGGGSAGWMAAAALARFGGRAVSVELVESDEIGTVGVGEATIPQIRLFNGALGLDEDQFIRATKGSFKLGIEFVGWGDPKARYIHAFGAIGRALGPVPFHHYWLRHRAEGGAEDLWRFSASAQAARANRFARPDDRPGKLPSGVDYAFHFDAGLYAAHLRAFAEARGVKRTEGRIVGAERDGNTGDIAAVVLDGGRRVPGDLFVDCSGFRSLLVGDALGTPFEDWSRYLPCDRALAVPSDNAGPLTPYTRATAREAGWQWRIPLQHRTGNGHVYCSAHLDDDEAARVLLANLDGPALADPKPIRFTTGKRRQAWAGNAVALGLAAGFMEPLESTSIHLVQAGVSRLLDLLPGPGRDSAALRDEFNRQTDAEWLAIRDFLVLHYHRNGREGAFWAACRDMTVPDTLRHKLHLFEQAGAIAPDGRDLFREVAWLQVMTGQGVRASAYHPLADAIGAEQLAEFLALAKRHASGVAAAMPRHEDTLAVITGQGRNARVLEGVG